MDRAGTEKLLADLGDSAASILEVTETARRNRKSLDGVGRYANRFHEVVLHLTKLESKLRPVLVALELDAVDLASIGKHLGEIKSSNPNSDKVKAKRHLERIIHAIILPKLDAIGQAAVPNNQHVLPMEVVRETRGYFVKIITQANGNYEHGWFDACCVMIRKFVEILIIEVYEYHHRETDIKDCNGDFLLLSHLIDKVLADLTWNLSRNTKKGLRPIKELGDKAAHARRFIATKADVDRVIPGLRDVADEFLHLASLK